jgi:hypothetical protein
VIAVPAVLVYVVNVQRSSSDNYSSSSDKCSGSSDSVVVVLCSTTGGSVESALIEIAAGSQCSEPASLDASYHYVNNLDERCSEDYWHEHIVSSACTECCLSCVSFYRNHLNEHCCSCNYSMH